jgi:hypothetical protein
MNMMHHPSMAVKCPSGPTHSVAFNAAFLLDEPFDRHIGPSMYSRIYDLFTRPTYFTLVHFSLLCFDFMLIPLCERAYTDSKQRWTRGIGCKTGDGCLWQI